MDNIGRLEIFTDEKEVTSENIIKVLQDAIGVHRQNVERMNYLLAYDAGVQPLMREKKVRKDIDIHCVDNIANEITEFNLGYKWGYPITLVQRGDIDSGTSKETDGIALLNECYAAAGGVSSDQKMARFIEICGVGYSYIDINTEYEEGDSYFVRQALDPRYTFVVRSTRYLDKRVVLAVTYGTDTKGNNHYTCFTKDRRYEIANTLTENKWFEDVRSGELNPIGKIPIIEWVRSYDRMGAWERQIPEMDNLNLLISDFTNDIDQTTQAFWHANDCDFPKKKIIIKDEYGQEQEVEMNDTPVSGDWAITYTSPDGKTPFIKPLTIPYDYNGMLNNIVTRRSLILQKCNVPQRNDNSGGSTGIAMSDATGWSAADAAANKQQEITEACKMEEIKVVLAAIKKSPDVPLDSELLKLKYSDIKPNIKRQRTYEMTTKVNAFATGVSHGLDWKTLVREYNMFDDPEQAIADSKKTMKMYIDSTLKKEEPQQQQIVNGQNPNDKEGRHDPDMSDQEGNSPMIDGTTTDKEEKDDNRSGDDR